MKTTRKAQEGVIALVWLYVGAAILVLLALAGLVKVWSNYTSGLVKEGYDHGVAETTASYTKRDNAQLQAVVVAQRQAEDRAAKAEADAAKSQSLASANYQRGILDGKTKLAAFIDSARAGGIELRDPGSQAGTGPACDNQAGKAETTGAAGVGNGQAGGGLLSKDATVFLATEANRADEIVLQLTAAQAVIVSDRTLCNSP